MQILTCRLTPSPDMTIIQMDKPFREGSMMSAAIILAAIIYGRQIR